MRIQLISGILTLTLISLGASKFGLLGAIAGNIGFLLTWLMVFFGLKSLKISNLLWLKSSLFFLVWLTICILGKLLISQFELLIIFYIAQATFAIIYFINIFRKELNVLFYKPISKKD
jgi:O-antigen/teichoic acid export membrane protein